ncbi:MAG: LysR family transcriptional regulator, partial [Pseudolabrys sp.]
MGRPSRSVALFRYECAPDMKDIFALKLYTRVARLGSFSAAARECNLSQSQASRIVAELEESLGTRLLS